MVQVELPGDVSWQEARLALALGLYVRGRLGLEAAARYAEMSSKEFSVHAKPFKRKTSRDRTVWVDKPGDQPAGSWIPSNDEEVQTIAIDWSGAKEPVKKGIWLAAVRAGRIIESSHCASRGEAIERACTLARAHPRTVLGLDFAFSFPSWFVQKLECDSGSTLWKTAKLRGEQWLIDCPPPFWGTKIKKPTPSGPVLRKTDEELQRDVGHGQTPKSVFQVHGIGTVGTGSIRGMPHLLTLQSAGYRIWPFDAPAWPLCVEIYPRLFTPGLRKSDPEDRVRWIRKEHSQIGGALLDQIEESDDALDAIASALAMAAHAADIEHLPFSRECAYYLEGCIWQPS